MQSKNSLRCDKIHLRLFFHICIINIHTFHTQCLHSCFVCYRPCSCQQSTASLQEVLNSALSFAYPNTRAKSSFFACFCSSNFFLCPVAQYFSKCKNRNPKTISWFCMMMAICRWSWGTLKNTFSKCRTRFLTISTYFSSFLLLAFSIFYNIATLL